MIRKKSNTVKLGIFVMAGMAFLVLLLYVIGKNQNLFGSTFVLKARFENVRGLMPGNNIRFAGIDAGTVKKVEVLNDTTIEVTLLVKTKMKKFIRRNATVSIGTDGLMGNKLLNIQAEKGTSAPVEEGDVLMSEPLPDTEEMLKVLRTTNMDVADIARELRQTVLRLNSSKAIWGLLEDKRLPEDIRHALERIRQSSDNMNGTMMTLHHIVDDIHQGRGTIGQLLTDTTLASGLSGSVEQIKRIGIRADSLSVHITTLVDSISEEINHGQGTVNALLKDREMTQRFSNSLTNIEEGTRAFHQNMEALKHNFLFRGYFKKQERQRKTAAANPGNY